jgi:sterol desaturase/sphingolipid hydroxylase (fatty acid hydroxylase superfamily)
MGENGLFNSQQILTDLTTQLSVLVNPANRLYWPFLLLSLLVYFFYYGIPAKGTRLGLLKQALIHPSFHTDLGLFTLNAILRVTAFSWIFLLGTDIAWTVQSGLGQWFPSARSSLSVNLWHCGLFTFLAFAFDDFLRFAMHLCMHKIPFLWQFHRVHHSAEVLTPLTLYRTHPVEVFLSSFRNTFSAGVVAGAGIFLFNQTNVMLTLMGVGIFGFVFNAALANLRHTSVPLRFAGFEKWVISPYMHQIHHSSDPRHFDKNFGTCLSLWDRIVGSWLAPASSESLRFGVTPALTSQSVPVVPIPVDYSLDDTGPETRIQHPLSHQTSEIAR